METKSRHTQQGRQSRYVPGTSRGQRSATTLLAQLADVERGDRIRARREELHLTQPAVVELLEKAAWQLPRDHDLHPDKAGKAPVTLRGYQTYEQGGGIVWEKAKLLAQVLQLDVQAMMHGGESDPGPTPDPFPSPAIEGTLAGILADIQAQLAEQNRVLDDIKRAVQDERQAAKDAREATRRLLAAVDQNRPALRGETPLPAVEPDRPAKSG